MASCVIVEDETLMRDALVQQLAQAWPELEVAVAREVGAAALESIAACQPDVAFFDIRMPGLSGSGRRAGRLQPAHQVVFVTAYDQYAIGAFERGAVDYPQKPVAPERLAATVRRLEARAAAANPDPDAAALAAPLRQLGGHGSAPGAAPPLW